MRILHVFDHSIPLHSGYTFRSYQILKEQRRLGYETLQVTGLKQHSGGQQGEGSRERVEDLEFLSQWMPALYLVFVRVRELEDRLGGGGWTMRFQ